MNRISHTALAFLNQDPVLRAQALTAYQRGQLEVLAEAKDALLLYDGFTGFHLLCADSEEGARQVLPALPAGVHLLVHDLESMNEFLSSHLGLPHYYRCHHLYYPHRTPLKTKGTLALRPIKAEQAAQIAAIYHIVSEEDIQEAIRENRLLGGFAGEDFVGFVGWHKEGGIGMLQVFPAFRRQGHGEELERLVINLSLKKGELPYGQVVYGNQASLRLQEKLGLLLHPRAVTWMFQQAEMG